MKKSFNRQSLLKDGAPFFPFMGEFHYSRYPKEGWETEIRKMKAGGVTILSTYVIWIHHEEIEGKFDFSGQRSLHDFLKICQKCHMPVCLRLGPWVHGEVRNGGFPDWLLNRGWNLRTNDENYLAKVRLFWEHVYEQAEDFMDQIIAIQMENEYGHVGGLTGDAGNEHLHTLTNMARQIGFRAEYWTATGWGGAVIDDLIPVMGAYCDAPWASFEEQLPPNKNYLFTTVRNDGNIGSDVHTGMSLSFEKENYPYLTAELGGGVQVTHHRRPRISGSDIAAMTLAKLGSGCNLLGYYMYHGGTNPNGKCTTLQESTASGSFCDLPVYSYDFQAPIGEFGQIRDSLKELKLFAFFAKAFGAALCEMDPVFDRDMVLVIDSNATDSGTGCTGLNQIIRYGEQPDADDTQHLRAIVRQKDENGYLFINNYQRLHSMDAHINVALTLKRKDGTITWPEQDIRSQTFFFYPFHFDLEETILNWANQTPLTRLGSRTWVFYGDQPLQYETAEPLVQNTILSLTREAAKNCWMSETWNDGMFVCPAPILETDRGAEILLRSDCIADGNTVPVHFFRASESSEDSFTTPIFWSDQMTDMPAPLEVFPDYANIFGNQDNVVCYSTEIQLPVCRVTCGWTLLCTSEEANVYQISVSYDRNYHFPEEEVFLKFAFAGDLAELYLDETCIADQYFYGDLWEVGLGRFGFPETLKLKIYPLKETDPVFLDIKPNFKDGILIGLESIAAAAEIRKEFF